MKKYLSGIDNEKLIQYINSTEDDILKVISSFIDGEKITPQL